MIKIHSEYHGATGGYHVYMDGEEVFFTKDAYQRDMFMAELKAKIKIASAPIQQLTDKLKIAEEALEWYADEDNHDWVDFESEVFKDRGRRANEALSLIREVNPDTEV